ncbi:MAG: hypothetical protein AAF679_03740 [Pseudomonadota bacterium]
MTIDAPKQPDMPETIWAHLDRLCIEPGETTGKWVDHGPGGNDETAYRRADLSPSREALEAMVRPLDFQKVGQHPPQYDAGQLPTGWYKVRYDNERGWKVVRGHMLIVGCADTPEKAFDLANRDHARGILSALRIEGEE